MREAIGGTHLLMIVVTIIIVIMMLLAGSVGYSKAFKARNGLINIVQRYGAYGKSAATIMENSKDEIRDYLSDMGYKTTLGTSRQCTDRCYSKFKLDDSTSVQECKGIRNDDYNFCLYHFTEKDTGNQYYGIETYMYFELPIFGSNDLLVFPLYADSYTYFKAG